jgi:hypothetical protein
LVNKFYNFLENYFISFKYGIYILLNSISVSNINYFLINEYQNNNLYSEFIEKYNNRKMKRIVEFDYLNFKNYFDIKINIY